MSPRPKPIKTKDFRSYFHDSQHFIFSVTYEWAHKQDFYIRLGLTGTNALAYWAHSLVIEKLKCCEYVPRT